MKSYYNFKPLANPSEGTSIVKFSKVFSDTECDMIQMLENFIQIDEIGVSTKNNMVSKTRRSKAGWIQYENNIEWLFDKIVAYGRKANNEVFRFNIEGLHEPFQYTIYEQENEGFYNWHLDIGVYNEMTVTRKMSMSMVLNDPAEYEGGDLEIWGASGVVSAPREQGTPAFFPSFLLHRVTPVTKGTRKSLVVWFGGPNWQ